MNELTGIPSVVLEAELKRRAAEKEKDQYTFALERADAIRKMLAQPGIVDALAPEHDRTSCTDENLNNGHGTETRLPRCRRCQLLKAQQRGSWPLYLTLNVQIGLWVE